MKIEYPTFMISYGPTPSETLYCCDKCGRAEWAIYLDILKCDGCNARYRKGTKEEIKEAKAAIKTTIGLPFKEK